MRFLGRLVRRALALLAILLIVAGIALWFVVRSAWFSEKIRTRIVQTLERAAGGKSELDAFRFDPATWQVSVDGLTLHGTEAANEPPLVHIKSATIGWKLISLVDRKVNVLSIDVDSPEVFIHRDAKGNWNLPRAQTPPSGVSPVDQLIDLKAGRIHVSNGLIRFEEQLIPLAFDAKNAEVTLAAELNVSNNRAAQAYAGTVKTSSVHMTRPLFSPIDAALESNIRLDHTGMQFNQARIGFGGSQIRAQGRMLSWTTPSLEATAEGNVLLADIRQPLRLPFAPAGRAQFTSKWNLANKEATGSGTLTGSDLDWTVAGVRVAPFSVDGDWSIAHHPKALDQAIIDNAHVGMLGGAFQGKAKITDWRDFTVDGAVADLALTRLYSLQDGKPFPWSGSVAGPISLLGTITTLTSAKSDLKVTRTEGGIPIDGQLTFDYDVAARRLAFAPSHIELAGSHAEFSGDTAGQLSVSATSSNLDELLPAVRFFTGRELRAPISLDGSQVKADGIITNRETFSGTIEAGRFGIRDTAYSGIFDSFRSGITASPGGVRLDGFRLQQQGAAVQGSLRAAWTNGTLAQNDAVGGQVQISGLDIARVLRDSAINTLPPEAKLGGMLTATLQLSGTASKPVIVGDTHLAAGSAWGEPIDRLQSSFRWSNTAIEIESAEVTSGRASAQLSGGFTPRTQDWRTGVGRFNVNATEANLRRWISTLPEGFEAGIRGNAKGEFAVNNGTPTLAALEGTVIIPQLTLNGRPLGDATVEAASRGRVLTTKLTARMLGSQVRGNAEFSLNGNNPGLGQGQVIGLSLDNLRTLGLFGDPNRPLGARGSLDAEFGLSGPVFRPDQWTATAKVTRLNIEPRPTDSSIDGARFAVRNSGPLTGTFDRRGLTIESARIVGEGTDLNIAGSIGLRSRTPWNLALRGSFNLSGLSVLEPDLEATGVSTVDATVRGELYRPAINGRMEVADAAFRLRNVPNGLDQVTGLIRFDTNRATIERLTAQTGGGTASFTGFVGFGGPQLVYRLQADARRVRVRYPNEVSTTFDGKLALSGTATQSLLSGDVTVARIGLQAQADLGSLLAATARSAQSTPTQNAILRGMQLDIHVVTAPDAELQTSLTRDLQPQADVRVRGTAARPAALGRMTLSEGELTFFGTRYRVNRGEITLSNAARIEPILNFDLETTVRGVAVNINLNGPVDKLNPSYRSDPPLQPAEIISLLTVGRGPDTASSSQTTQVTTAAQQSAGGGSLLGGAISSTLAAPVAGRLQRLFGISRINIDPDLNSTSPQGRLTVEQQISRDIRLVYISTLSRTQNLIIRMQWDFSQDYSLVAVRDENGLFGMDFQFRKRFK